MQTLSVIIPAYNEENYIGACLKSIVANRTPAVTEIIVIDNASTDRTAEIAAQFPGVRVIREEKKGLTRARQCGLEHATGDILAWADADCRVTKEWFTKIEKAFEKNPQLVSYSGPYHYYDGSTLVQWLVSSTWVLFVLPTYWIVGYMVLGGNFAARRSALLAMGGFDTTIEFYGEDANIARRLSKVGHVKFSLFFYNWSSTRRFEKLGVLTISLIYAKNFLGEAFQKKPATHTYVDVR